MPLFFLALFTFIIMENLHRGSKWQRSITLVRPPRSAEDRSAGGGSEPRAVKSFSFPPVVLYGTSRMEFRGAQN
jgi:hypothetical protein